MQHTAAAVDVSNLSPLTILLHTIASMSQNHDDFHEKVVAVLGDVELAELELSSFKNANKRIKDALKDLNENSTPLQRLPCNIFNGCRLDVIGNKSMKDVLSKDASSHFLSASFISPTMVTVDPQRKQ